MSEHRPIDRIRMQLMWDRLLAVVEEQAQTLLRAAFSSMVRECGDLSAGVFDLQGRMLAQAVTGTPGHVNSMAESVNHFIAAFPLESMADGDIYLTNDPWKGTGHLNDFVVTTPCFHRGRLVAIFSCTSHLIDIGGIGYGPDAKDVHAEGIYLPFVKLAERGQMNQTLLDVVRANTRQPMETEGDVYSLAACNDIGCERLRAMLDEFGQDSLTDLSDYIIERSREAVMAEIATLPPGTWRSAMTVDGYDRPIELVAATTISASGVHVDFDGTSPVAPFGINVPLVYTTAYTCFGVSCVVSPRIPNNAGSLAPLTVSAPAGCILNAQFPSPVATRHVIGQLLPDVVFGGLCQAVPERIPAEGASLVWSVMLRGLAARRNAGDDGFTITANTNGGTGARPMKDGLSATAYPSGIRATPVEITESTAPLVYWRKELRPDSGGAGRFRGGHGQVVEIESLDGQPFELLAAFDRIDHPPRGRAGGAGGAAGAVGLESGEALRGKGVQDIDGRARLRVMTPGGGGFGCPLERDPDAVLADVLEEVVSVDAAARVYGVVVTATGEVDWPATRRRRVELRQRGAGRAISRYGVRTDIDAPAVRRSD